MIELKHFRLLQAVKRQGTLSGAAKELGYSQPAVTQQIQQFERALQTPVVVRNRSGVRLTEVGELIAHSGDSILPLVSLTQVEVEAIAGLRAGKIRVACFPSGTATLLPDSFMSMTEEFPGISFTLVEAEPPTALELLRTGECDIAVIYDYSTSPSATPAQALQQLAENEKAVTLFDDYVHVAVPLRHQLAGSSSVSLDELSQDKWIAGCPECRENLFRACDLVGYNPEIAFETDDYVAVQALVGAGLGVALITDLMAVAAHKEFSLSLLPVAPTLKRVVRAVTTKSLLRVPGVGLTIQALRTTATSFKNAPHQKKN